MKNNGFSQIIYKLQLLNYCFKIEKYGDKDFRFKITGNNVYGYLDKACTPYNKYYFYCDCSGLFDKYSKCPLVLPFPKNSTELEFLVASLNSLQSPEMYNASKYYQYECWINKYEDKSEDCVVR